MQSVYCIAISLQSVYIAKASFATQTVKGLYPKPKGLGFTPSTHNEVPQTLDKYDVDAEYVREVLAISESFLTQVRKKIVELN